MGLTTAMFTGLTGMNSNQAAIDTIGNNVANVNTTAFKGSRANFENQFAITLSPGSGPDANTGGTNPSQVGMGSMLGSVQKNFLPGAIENTGYPTDMAIQGAGFFVVRTPDLQPGYTRDGAFKLTADHKLTTADGAFVQGYGVDSDFNIVTSALTDVEIPLGAMNAARATRNAQFDGNLNASGAVATQGTILNSQEFFSGSNLGPAASESTLLTTLFDANATAPLFAVDDVITVKSARKGADGGRQLPEATFNVTASSTLGDFAAFLNSALGINQDPALPGQPGVRVGSGADAGKLIVEGNAGEENALTIGLADIQVTNPDINAPFSFTEVQQANGESVFTSFIAYDSLGNPITVDLTMSMVEKTNLGTTWRFYAESQDDTDSNPVLGTTGTLTFDNDGKLTNSTNNQLRVDRANTGALTPLVINLDFANVTDLAAPYTSQPSNLVMSTQDGYPSGTLNNFGVGPDGTIVGTFSNGLTRNLGQLVVATFSNQEGLVVDTNNLYRIGPNSGQPTIGAPLSLGAGSVLSGALELSNVDLTREFIGLIAAQTGFSASGRVITTSNELLNELLTIAR